MSWFPDAEQVVSSAKTKLSMYGEKVTSMWQSTKNVTMVEIMGWNSVHPMDQDPIKGAQSYVLKTDRTWAYLHAAERVAGRASNPGATWHLWKGANQADKFREEGVQFSHTYQERIWTTDIPGVRYKFGNMSNVVELLKKDPQTRQAFLPIFFPEDTGCHHGNRIPCTIGYHFMIRGGKLHMFYYARSIDLALHFRNDIFFCNYIADWVRNQVDPSLQLGDLSISIASLHVSESLFPILEKF